MLNLGLLYLTAPNVTYRGLGSFLTLSEKKALTNFECAKNKKLKVQKTFSPVSMLLVQLASSDVFYSM